MSFRTSSRQNPLATLPHKLQLKLQFPPLKPWFKCLRFPQLMLRILRKFRLLCRYIFWSLYCLVFPWLMFALSSFRPFVVHVAACWYHFFDSFSSPRFYFIFCTLIFRLGRFGRFARLLSPFAHLFFVLSVCFASQTPVCVVLFSSAPFSLAHVLFVM